MMWSWWRNIVKGHARSARLIHGRCVKVGKLRMLLRMEPLEDRMLMATQILAAGTDPGYEPRVHVYDAVTGKEQLQLLAFDVNFKGGVQVAVGDVNGDGQSDVVAAAGPGGGPHVRTFDGATGQPLSGPMGSFMAYDPRFTGGVHVATGDINDDGFDDVIVGTGTGGGPNIRVFSGKDGTVLRSFLAYDPNFVGGVHVASGDVNNDGVDDLITGAGPGGGAHVKVFSGKDTSVLASFFAYETNFTGGVYVATGDVSNDGYADLITGAGPGGAPLARIISGKDLSNISTFFAYSPDYTGGVRVATIGDATGDHIAEIVTGTAADSNPLVRVLDGKTLQQVDAFFMTQELGVAGFFGSGGGTLNKVPVAQPDTIVTTEDTAVSIGPLTNDTDADKDKLTILVVSAPAHGKVSIGGDQTTLLYTPAANHHGPDSFTYTIQDGFGGSATSTINVSVLPANDLPLAEDLVLESADEGDSITIDLRSLVSDVETDDSNFTYTIVSGPSAAQGTLTATTTPGVWTFTPAEDFDGAIVITYKVTDTGDGSASALSSETHAVTLTVSPINDAPSAEDGTAATAEDSLGILVDLTQLVSDAETGVADLQYTIVHGPSAAQGTLTSTGSNGKFRFTPAANYHGQVLIDYQVTDRGDGAAPALTSEVATVTITVDAVNDRPVASNHTIAIDEGSNGVAIDLTGLVTDVETAAAGLAYTIVTGPAASQGTLTQGQTNGGVIFTPAPNFHGNVQITWTATDKGDGAAPALTSEPATVTITVSAINDRPVASDHAITIGEDSGGVTLDLTGLVSDTETGNTDLVYAIVDGPDASQGTLTAAEREGVYHFTPAANFHGEVPITWTVTDTGAGNASPLTSEAATVTITVEASNDAPVAGNLFVEMIEDGASVTIDLTQLVSDVETDPADLTYEILTDLDPHVGTLIPTAQNGVFEFLPMGDFRGPVLIEYVVTDGGDGSDEAITSDPATILISVNAVNDRPTARDARFTMTEDDGSLTIDLTRLVTELETPIADLSYAIVDGPDASEGTLVRTSQNGVFTFTPAANFNGQVSFGWTVADQGDGDDQALTSDPGTITITVHGINDAPVALDGFVQTGENSPGVTIDLTALASDAETPAADLSYTIVSGPEADQGTLVEASPNGVFTFTPAEDFNGDVTITWQVSESEGTPALSSDLATLTITVGPVNAVPAASDASFTTTEDSDGFAIDLTQLVSDEETAAGDLTYLIVSGPDSSEGTLTETGTAGVFWFKPAANFNGETSIIYAVMDQGDGSAIPATSDPATITITIEEDNDVPVGRDTESNTSEDGSSVVVLDLRELASDVETADEDLTYTITDGPSAEQGKLTATATNGVFTFTPAANFNGDVEVRYTVTDDGDGSDAAQTSLPAAITIHVSAVNDEPTANDARFTTTEDGAAITIDLRDLTSDIETADGELTWAITSGPSAQQGTLTETATDGVWEFTPAKDFNGEPEMRYTVTDDGDGADGAATSAGTVTLAVDAVNDGPVIRDASFTTTEDSKGLVIDLTQRVSDVETVAGDLTYTIVQGPSSAEGMLSETDQNGIFTFTPAANFNGDVTITWSVTDTGDGAGAALTSALATITITVEADNDVPIGRDTELSTSEDGSSVVLIDLRDLASDIETADEDLTYTITDGPDASAGKLTATGTNGIFEFSPAENFNGDVSINYTVTDEGDGTDPARTSPLAAVTINVDAVNDVPTARDAALTISEDSAGVDIDLRTLVSDVETAAGDLTYSITQGPSAEQGKLTTTGTNGVFRFTPAADFNGEVTVTYTITDRGDGAAPALTSEVATVAITVEAVNDQPSASNGSFRTDEDSDAIIDLTQLVSDVETADEDLAFTILSSTDPSQGTLSATEANGVYRFTPAANFNGEATFTYQVTDTGDGPDGPRHGVVRTGTITVDPINDRPTALSGSATTTEDSAGILINLGDLVQDVETEVEDLTFTIVSEPGAEAGVLATTSANGIYRFIPAANFSGTTGFTYRVTDTGDGSALPKQSEVRSFTLIVNPVNDRPEVRDGTVTTEERAAVVIDLRELVSDVETEIDDLTYQIIGGVDDSQGTLEATRINGVHVFTPAENFNGTLDFRFLVTDEGQGGSPARTSALATVTITVDPVNDEPAASGADFTTTEDAAAIEIDLRNLVSDTETDVDDLVWTIVSGPDASAGMLVETGTNGVFRFTPAADFHGEAAFLYTVTDAGDGSDAPLTSDPATVTIMVDPINDRPVARDAHFTTIEDSDGIEIDLRTLVSDPETDTSDLVWTIVSGPDASAGTLVETGTNGIYHFTPAPNFNGDVAITWTVTDSGDAGDAALTSAPATATITVEEDNDVPIGRDSELNTGEDGSSVVLIDLREQASDVETDDEDLTYAITDGPEASEGTLTSTGTNGVFRFTPAENFNGGVTIGWTVTDAGDGDTDPRTSAEATVAITVEPVNDRPSASNGTASTPEDGAGVDIDLRELVSDVETADKDLVYAIVSGPETSQGTLTATSTNGVYHFTPASDFAGKASFSFQVADAGDGSDEAETSSTKTVTLTVTAVNDAPVRTAGTVSNLTVAKNSGSTSLGLGGLNYGTGGGSDEASQTLTFTVTELPSITEIGYVTLSNGTPVIMGGQYTLSQVRGLKFVTTPGKTGTGDFRFQVSDNGGTSNGGVDRITESIRITVADQPVS